MERTQSICNPEKCCKRCSCQLTKDNWIEKSRYIAKKSGEIRIYLGSHCIDCHNIINTEAYHNKVDKDEALQSRRNYYKANKPYFQSYFKGRNRKKITA